MKYLIEILKHKCFVLVAGIRLGGLPLWRLMIHDLSKFSPAEFIPYRRRFELNNCSEDDWGRAWIHHIRHNKHHWEHWVSGQQEPRKMPDSYVREMVVDWLAAGRSYNGSWNIQPWISHNYNRIKLHPESKTYLITVLAEQGLKLQ